MCSALRAELIRRSERAAQQSDRVQAVQPLAVGHAPCRNWLWPGVRILVRFEMWIVLHIWVRNVEQLPWIGLLP
jgi:hypothetical protein